MKKWSAKDLKRLGVIVPPHSRSVKLPKEIPKGVMEIKNLLTLLKYDFVQELQFDDDRRFRFDFALPGHRIAIEYEGLNSEKSGHTTLFGYTSDCEKYNLATSKGWRVLRYTILNYQQVGDDLKKMINEQSSPKIYTDDGSPR